MDDAESREQFSTGKRIYFGLYGLFSLFVGLWFGLGTLFLIWVLYIAAMGHMEWKVEVPERVLFGILVLAFIVGCGVGSLSSLVAGYAHIVLALRGWAPRFPNTYAENGTKKQ